MEIVRTEFDRSYKYRDDLGDGPEDTVTREVCTASLTII